MLAMERGEVEGHTTTWDGMKSRAEHHLRDKTINMLVQYGLKRHPELPDVPTSVELGRTPEQVEALRVFANATDVGRFIFSTPDTPADRIQALRRAFDAMVKDPEYHRRPEAAEAGASARCPARSCRSSWWRWPMSRRRRSSASGASIPRTDPSRAREGHLDGRIASGHGRRDSKGAGPRNTQPRLDLQEHLADLEARGLLTRIDHPVNKDTELHPLVRLQFIGGIPETERRAFLFTNVVDGTGRKYDMPVVVGSIAASAEIYSLGMRAEVEDIGKRWMDGDRASDPADQDQRRALPGGRHHRRRSAQARRRPEDPAGADLDARLRFRAVSQRHLLRHQGPGFRHPERRHVSRCA